MIPQPGDLVKVGAAAGLQYGFRAPFLFRIGQVNEYVHSPDGSVWLTGYEIDAAGLAVENGHHEIWIPDPDGLVLVERPTPRPATRRPVNRGPIPRQRTGTSITARSLR